jgi:sarcosine oxidase subunit alpha
MRPDRKQLVGLLPDNTETVLPEGTQLVESSYITAGKWFSFGKTAGRGKPMIGHVTSSYWSPTLRRAFALALIKDGRRLIGGNILAELDYGAVSARVVAPQFFDKEGVRQHG